MNNTTGRCTWRWETSPFGDGRLNQAVNQNQGLDEFPVIWDCVRDRVAANLAFCVNVRTRPTGCSPDSLVFGQCCFVDGQGQQQCLVLTADECAVNYDGLFASGGTCNAPCPPAQCVVTCQAGDIREAEGCGFDKNGGCDDDVLNPPIEDLGVLTCFDLAVPGSGSPIVICGTANDTDQPGNDSDWYSFTFADPSGLAKITMDLEAQPDLIIELWQRVLPGTPNTDGCAEGIIGVTSVDGDCTPIQLNAGCQPNGEYLLILINS